MIINIIYMYIYDMVKNHNLHFLLGQKGAAKNDKHHIWMISYHGGKLPIVLNGGRVIVVPQLVGDHLVVGFLFKNANIYMLAYWPTVRLPL